MPNLVTRTRKPFLFLLATCLVFGQHLRAQPKTRPKPPAGTTKTNLQDGLKYVWIPAGTFQMGCSPGDSECKYDEKPLHTVTLSKGFWLGQTDVTAGAYERFLKSTHRPAGGATKSGSAGGTSKPATNVSWEDARAYCKWAGGRLPTEAEWEYAARGGSTEPRYGPIDTIAWYIANSDGGRHDVAEKQANGFGLFDMLGNVWQWVADWNDGKYYEHSPAVDPKGPKRGGDRVLRGGSWSNQPKDVRVSVRSRTKQVGGVPDAGFRCACENLAP